MTTKCPNCKAENPDTKQFCGDCGTQLTPAKEAPIPTQTLEAPREELTTGSIFAGRYQIIEELGKGGMGKVYRVLDKKLNEEVALKLIKPEIASDKKTLERFQNELKLARKIRHGNVGGMYELLEDKNLHYITMEYVSGEDLKSFIHRSGRLTISKAINIAKQICDGLSEAHKLNIVHRDLKPSNIMIDKDGNVRIMDFGIARSLRGKSITGAGVMIGTPEYMSPEQVEGKDVDHRSDIYSLGVILYEMVSGRVPFEGDTALSLAMKHKSEAPKDPKEYNAQILDDLSYLILKCLEKDKDTRFQSAGEVQSELENIEKGIPTTDRAIPSRKPLTSKEITVTFGLKRLLLPVLVLIAVVIIALAIWRPWSKKAPSPLPSDKPSLAVMYFENNTGDESLDHWRKGISDLLITDLTQSKYIKVLGGDRLFNILSEIDQLETKSFSSEVLKEVATRGGVNHIARGSYSKAGDILRIDMVLQDAHSGEPIATQRIEGKGEEGIFAMVDELTNWTKSTLKLSSEQVADDLDKEIGTITTSSPEAFKFYSEGVDLYLEQKWEQSIESLEKAIALDPGFAMAFRQMALAFANTGKYNEEKKYFQKALELSDRLTEREKLLIQGDAFRIIKPDDSTYNKSIEAYKELIDLYPESWEAVLAVNNLGAQYEQNEDWGKAIECFETAIEAGIKYRGTYTGLAYCYMAKGEYQKAKKVLEDAINLFTDNLSGHWNLAKLYAFQGQFDLAMDEVDKAAAIDPTYTKARFYHLMWDFVKAEEEFIKWFDHVAQSTQIQARWWLDCLYRTLGKFEEGKSQLLHGIDLAEEAGLKNWIFLNLNQFLAYHYLRSGNYEEILEPVEKVLTVVSGGQQAINRFYILELKGWICADIGKMAEAWNAAEEIKGLIGENLYKKRIRHYHFVMGKIELKKRNYSDAVEHFKKAISLLPHAAGWFPDNAYYRYNLAMAYYDSGDKNKACDEFEWIIGFIPGRISWGDLYAQSYYKLGKIYEEKGDTAKAIEHYEKFLDLWKDADPGIAEVEDAREKLVGLTTNQ